MNDIVLLWSVAVFLASVFAVIIIGVTLPPKHGRKITIINWLVFGVPCLAATYISYSIDLTNDFFGVLILAILICIPTHLLYIGTASSKLFVSLMASLIANVVTFMFCGTADTLLAMYFGLIKESPYEINNLVLFIVIKLVVYIVCFILYKKYLLEKIIDMMKALLGDMKSFVIAPVISLVGFYIINLFTNTHGILPNVFWFFPLYLTICTIFFIEFYLIFYSVLWSSRAMKNATELNIATNIQAAMLPCIFPAFPEREEFCIYASMKPAKEVGGDFYDFFLIDEDKLVMIIADVSGKGVPAALFMTISKILLKNACQLGVSPKQVLEQVNNQLCENNEAEMFVTVWLGILEISTMKMTCSNAGHEYPVLKRANGEYELFKDKHGLVLAGMEKSRYKEYEIEFQHGDSLFVYTDGVPEATNSMNELFGVQRMLESLNKKQDALPDELLPSIKADIDEFVGHAPQFDDITMLGIYIK